MGRLTVHMKQPGSVSYCYMMAPWGWSPFCEKVFIQLSWVPDTLGTLESPAKRQSLCSEIIHSTPNELGLGTRPGH